MAKTKTLTITQKVSKLLREMPDYTKQDRAFDRTVARRAEVLAVQLVGHPRKVCTWRDQAKAVASLAVCGLVVIRNGPPPTTSQFFSVLKAEGFSEHILNATREALAAMRAKTTKSRAIKRIYRGHPSAKVAAKAFFQLTKFEQDETKWADAMVAALK